MSDDERSVPRWVWVAAFLVAVSVVTLLRPHLRRIPEPPPDLGHIGAVEGSSLAGVADLGAVGAPRAWLLVGDVDASRAGLRIARKLEYARAASGSVDPHVIVVVAGATGEGRKSIARVAHREPALASRTWVVDEATAEALRARLRAQVGADVWDGSALVLVDGQGQVRGGYGTDVEEVVSEVLHRATHVSEPAGNPD